MTLYAADDASMTMARSVLDRDPHIKLLAFDPTVIDKQKTDCGTASCQEAITAACSWSALQGAEYYAIASVYAAYSSSYECTKYDSHLFDKHDECVEGHETNQATAATYSLDVYDVKTCTAVPALSQKLMARAWGPEETSKPEALAKLAARVPAKSEGLPDQITIGPDGRVVGEAARDGFYALYRAGQYRGYVELRGAGTPAEQLRPMYFPMAPAAGDALVARGRRKFVDLALDVPVGFITFDGTRHAAGGIGLQLRHYALDGGLQYGFGVDLLASPSTDSNLYLFAPELGYGVPIAAGMVLSLNLGVGLTRGNHQVDLAGERPILVAYAPHALAVARLQTFLATAFYVTADVGFVYSGALDDWKNDGATVAQFVMSMRSPIARLNIGFDL